MSQYGGQRRADDRRGTYTQKLATPVDDRRTTYTQKKKSINGEDDDDRRSIATTRGRQKPSLAVISTHRLEWINLVRYLELELKDFGVQLPKDEQVRQSSRCVFLWPMTACRVLVRERGRGGGRVCSAANFKAWWFSQMATVLEHHYQVVLPVKLTKVS